jgi:hypothetical protein
MTPRAPSEDQRRSRAAAILALISGMLLVAIRRSRRDRPTDLPALATGAPYRRRPRARVSEPASTTASVPGGGALLNTPWAPPRRRAAIDGALLALTAATVVVSALDPHGVDRLLLVLASACLLPGAALLTRLTSDDLLSAFALAVALSLCIETVGALAMIWTGWWHPLGFSIVLAALCAGFLALDLRISVAAVGGDRQ